MNDEADDKTDKTPAADDLLTLKAEASLVPDQPPAVTAANEAAAKTKQAQIEEWAGLLYGLAVPTVEMFAPNWEEHLTNEAAPGSKVERFDKLKIWAMGCAPALQKHFPDVNTSPELTALLITGMTFGPLYTVPRYAKQGAANG